MKSIKSVRIFNDTGIGYGTKVTDAETGEEVKNVAFISLNFGPCDRMQAIIHVINPVIDVIADADIRQVCPCCGQMVIGETA
jgi:hypothetical protein